MLKLVGKNKGMGLGRSETKNEKTDDLYFS